MKFILTLLIVLSNLIVFGQNETINGKLNKQRDIIDCEMITLNAVDLLSKKNTFKRY